ncbi:MAG: alpha/beta fold hydrolase [Candidatus Alcyoniella australis]|nr:alpha/beta fold hydrolase [Candidatus Alcyoniella australis]
MLALLIIVVVIWLVIATSKLRYGPVPKPDEVHYTTARDGRRLALHRYRPQGENPCGEPVLIHHGFTGSHDAFDMGLSTPQYPVPSLSRWLSEQGYDVYACDLRGRGFSEKPKPFGDMKWDWTLDDYVHQDDPAFLDYVIERSDFSNAHWVGLSMGGVLLFCHCALHGSDRLASGVSLGGGLDYSGTGSAYEGQLKALPILNYIRRMPVGKLSRLIAPFCGRWELDMERFNYNPPNISPRAQKAMYGGLISDVSSNVMKQLATMFSAPGLRTFDGKTAYIDMAGNACTPILNIHGTADRQAPPALGQRNMSMLKGDQHKLVVVGKEHGQLEDYGHIDLVNGMHADTEVYPHILDWLKTHPAEKK